MRIRYTKYQMLYLHHFNEMKEMAWDVEVFFSNVVFGIAPAIPMVELEKRSMDD